MPPGSALVARRLGRVGPEAGDVVPTAPRCTARSCSSGDDRLPGRFAIFEVLNRDPDVERVISAGRHADKIAEAAQASGCGDCGRAVSRTCWRESSIDELMRVVTSRSRGGAGPETPRRPSRRRPRRPSRRGRVSGAEAGRAAAAPPRARAPDDASSSSTTSTPRPQVSPSPGRSPGGRRGHPAPRDEGSAQREDTSSRGADGVQASTRWTVSPDVIASTSTCRPRRLRRPSHLRSRAAHGDIPVIRADGEGGRGQRGPGLPARADELPDQALPGPRPLGPHRRGAGAASASPPSPDRHQVSVVDVYVLRPAGGGWDVLCLRRAPHERSAGTWETVHGTSTGERRRRRRRPRAGGGDRAGCPRPLHVKPGRGFYSPDRRARPDPGVLCAGGGRGDVRLSAESRRLGLAAAGQAAQRIRLAPRAARPGRTPCPCWRGERRGLEDVLAGPVAREFHGGPHGRRGAAEVAQVERLAEGADRRLRAARRQTLRDVGGRGDTPVSSGRARSSASRKGAPPAAARRPR